MSESLRAVPFEGAQRLREFYQGCDVEIYLDPSSRATVISVRIQSPSGAEVVATVHWAYKISWEEQPPFDADAAINLLNAIFVKKMIAASQKPGAHSLPDPDP